jgi:hypothetical protein
VERTLDYIRPPWYTNDGKSMDLSLCKMRKGTPNEMFREEFPELVNEKYNDHTRIYTDGSKKKKRIRSCNRSAINTKNDKRPIINIQCGSRSHHRRNTEGTDNGGVIFTN